MKLKVLLICLGIAVGVGLFGISLSSSVGPEPISIRDWVPPEMAEMVEDANSVAVAKRINIIILPSRAVIGGAIGGIFGLFISFAIGKHKVTSYRKGAKVSKQRKDMDTHNLKALFIFLGITIILWIAFYVLIVKSMSEPLDSIKYSVARQLAGLLAIICSWLAVRKKFIWSKKWSRRKNLLMLGPFSHKKIPFMNDKQLKALWITIVFMFLALLFPPWVVYKFAMGNVGGGTPTFAGFHFLLSSQYSIVGTSPYILTEISYRILCAWEVFLLAAFVTFVVIFRGKRLKAKQ